ncbi:MAG TPA: hypothetical protein VD788_15945, partial [Candidatus Polarisedimenticolaceae bacterium]|nr:hypothetical protein [Candidatus Polarisedimenticolaceae bacterium]
MRIEKLDTPADRLGHPLYAEHRADRRFFNPWSRFPHRLPSLLRFWLRPKPRIAFRARPTALRLPRVARTGCAITAVGHCTFVIGCGDSTLVTDPHWGPRSKIERRKTPPGVAIDALPNDAV